MKKLELAIQQAAERISNEKDRFRQIPRPCACGKPAPSSDALHHIIEGLWDVIFPLRFNKADLEAKSEKEFIAGMLKKLLPGLMEQIHRGICFFCGQDAGQDCKKCEEKAKELTEKFIGTLPKIQMMVAGDVKAHYEGDPAATCLEEMILCYPGVLAVTCYRIAHQLLKLGVPLIPRMMTELAHRLISTREP
jgi:serine O-acetyltransferase